MRTGGFAFALLGAVGLIVAVGCAAAQSPGTPGDYWAENRPPAGGPRSLPKRLFPATNWWNQDISGAPVDPRSGAYIAALTGVRLNYDWGNNYGLPYTTVSGDYPKVRFAGGSYWGESDDVPYPIPTPALTEAGWTEELGAKLTDMIVDGVDRHLLIVDVDNQRLYEIYQPFYNGGTTAVRWGNGAFVQPGQYYCASAATWDLRTNDTRPEGWTSSDAAGLQVLPGLVQYDEVVGSEPITHAHRVTLNFSASEAPLYVWPATHYAGNFSSTNPPLGARFRLKAGFDISRFGPNAQRLLQAFKTHGLIFADNGASGLVTGTNDPRWGNYDSSIRVEFATGLTAIDFSDLEVVALGWR